jgi:hypothetical protein
MCSHRPYRPALGLDLALEEISENREILYDAMVVEACLKLYAPRRGELHPFRVPDPGEKRVARHASGGKPGHQAGYRLDPENSALLTLRRFLYGQYRFLLHVFIAMILGGIMFIGTGGV